MSDFKSRLEVESKELLVKTEKLSEFITGDIFSTLDSVQKDLLVIQLGIMSAYIGVLSARLDRL